VLMIVLGLTWWLGVIGASWTAVVASLSIVTVALGLALQDVLKNLVAGIYVLLEQPFKIGDQIAVKGVAGKVEGIDIRTTIIRTNDGLQVLVPNSIVFTDILTNRSAYDTHRVSLQLQGIRTAFQDLNRLVNEALDPFEEVARTPAPLVKIQSVEDSSATVTVDYWQRGAAPIVPEVLASLRATFPEAKITVVSTGDLPAPQAT
jgi:small conductance mechanosensitive channel